MSLNGGGLHSPICDLLGCRYPILLAGMGGVARWELAAAISGAGGFAQLGMVRESPDLIRQEVLALRAATARNFSVNLIPAATEAGLLDREIGTCLDLGVSAFTFFWDVHEEAVRRVKDADALLIHQVGTLEAARHAEAMGADILIVQGVEAGGHVHGRVGLLPLLTEIASFTKLPLVASGGIATGAGMAAALMAGAQGVQCGTAFLATHESFAHEYHKQQVVAAQAEDTVLTDIFVLNWPAGAAVRVIGNSVTEPLGTDLLGYDPDVLPHDVIADEAGRPIYRFSTDSPLRVTTGDLEAMAIFAGQSVSGVHDICSTSERLHQIVSEAETSLRSAARWISLAAEISDVNVADAALPV